MATTGKTVAAMRDQEAMLKEYISKLRLECGLKIAELANAAPPQSRTEKARRGAEWRQVAGAQREEEAARVELKRLTPRRKAAERRLFAGQIVPAGPLDRAAMFISLLLDYDELPEEYLPKREWAAGESPLSRAWCRNEEALLALDVATNPEAATAYYHAAKRDEDEGAPYHWDDDKVELASRLALPALPRPR